MNERNKELYLESLDDDMQFNYQRYAELVRADERSLRVRNEDTEESLRQGARDAAARDIAQAKAEYDAYYSNLRANGFDLVSGRYGLGSGCYGAGEGWPHDKYGRELTNAEIEQRKAKGW